MNRFRCAIGALLVLMAESGEAGSLIGRVVDAAGRAPSSVRIEIVPWMDGNTDENGGTPSKKLAGTAAADGSFRIDLPADWPPSEIRVSSAGSVTLRAADVIAGADDFDLGLLTLPPAQILQGIVRDESGRSVSGAHVKALAVNGRADVLPAESITDQAGRYVILDAPERVAQMIVTHARYVSQSAPRTRSAWILKQGGAIQGVLLDDRGRPVLNAKIAAADHVVRSAALGTFELHALPPGLTRVIASDDQGRIAIADVVVVDRETVSATLCLRPGVVVRGTVRDAASGAPVPRARVRVYQGPPSGNIAQQEHSAIADASGIFRVAGLEPAQYTFEARRSPYLRAVQSHTVTPAARSLEIALLLTREARIEGEVIDNAGRPIAGARVSVSESNPVQELARQLRAGRRDAATTYSDAHGRFVLRELWPGRALRVEASASKFVPARLDGIELAAGAVRSGLSLILHAGATATGTVTDRQDRPLANVQVYSTRIDESGAMPAAAALLQASDTISSTTDDDGRYLLSGLEQGRYFQTFVRQGYSRGFMPATHILAGTINELPPITLAPAVAIRGRVVNQQRGPVSGATVYAIDRTLDVRSAFTDADGNFELTHLTDGDDVSLQVESDRSAPAQVKVRAPASDVTIQLSEALAIRGRVYDAATSQPLTAFSVERVVRGPGTITFRLGGPPARPFFGDDGSFELSGVAPGPCTLRVRASGYQTSEIVLPSVPITDEIAVAMRRGTSVAGRVLLAGSRQPVPNATITWRQGDASQAELEAMLSSLATAEDSATSDDEGRFVLQGIPSGAVTMIASHAEYAPIRTNITVPARSALELIMSAGGMLAGVVTLDQGGPAAGATVALTPAGERLAMAPPDTATADAAGRFRFNHLREGSYTLVARAPTGASSPLTVAIAGSEQHEDLVLTLRSGTTIRGSVRGLRRDDQSNVFVMAHGEGYYDSTYTDATGAFLLPHVPAGAVALEATTSFRQGQTAGAHLEVPENGPATIDVDIEFGGQSELAGIVSRAGRPVQSLSISATPLLPSVTTRGRAESAADGSYRMEGLSDGQYQVVVSDSFALYRRIADVKGPTRLDLALPSGSITGRVTDAASHEAVARATVAAISGRERSPADVKQTVTDSQANYTLADLDAGTYQVRATGSGYQQEARVVTVEQSEQQADFELQRHDGVRLRVVDAANGAPVSHANVRVTAQQVLVFADTVVLDNAGRADVPSLPPGDYVLTVLVAGYAPRSQSIRIPTASVDVAVDRGGRVELRLAAATSTRVRLVDAAGIAQAVPGADPAGWTAVAGPTTVWANVSAGAYRLESMTGGAAAITVRPGTTSAVDVK